MTTSKYGYALNFNWKHPWPRAPIPANEDERLAELAHYAILDSEPDEKFDKLCRIACKEMKCPIAAVSFIDKQRQWFKANSGLTQKQIPRDVALCAHTIMHPKRALIVEDASIDERFMNNPLVTRASAVRFYAGVPITTPNGFCIGSVFVLDVKSHQDANAMILHKIAAKVLKYMDERLKHNAGPTPSADSTEQTPGETALREQQHQHSDALSPKKPAKKSMPASPVMDPAPESVHHAHSVQHTPAPPVPSPAAPPSPVAPPSPPPMALHYADEQEQEQEPEPPMTQEESDSQQISLEATALVEAASANAGAIEAAGNQPANLGNMGSMLMNLLARTTETQQQLAAQQGVMFDTLGTHGQQLESLNESMSKLEIRLEQAYQKKQARAAQH